MGDSDEVFNMCADSAIRLQVPTVSVSTCEHVCFCVTLCLTMYHKLCPTIPEQLVEYACLTGTYRSFTSSHPYAPHPPHSTLPPLFTSPSHWFGREQSSYANNVVGRRAVAVVANPGNMKLHLHVIEGGRGSSGRRLAEDWLIAPHPSEGWIVLMRSHWTITCSTLFDLPWANMCCNSISETFVVYQTLKCLYPGYVGGFFWNVGMFTDFNTFW